MALAETLFEAGTIDDSRRLFESLAAEPRAAPAAELWLGRIDASKGRHDLAIPHFQRAIALFPEFGAAYYALALSYRAQGRTDEAQRALEQHASSERGGRGSMTRYVTASRRFETTVPPAFGGA